MMIATLKNTSVNGSKFKAVVGNLTEPDTGRCFFFSGYRNGELNAVDVNTVPFNGFPTVRDEYFGEAESPSVAVWSDGGPVCIEMIGNRLFIKAPKGFKITVY